MILARPLTRPGRSLAPLFGRFAVDGNVLHVEPQARGSRLEHHVDEVGQRGQLFPVGQRPGGTQFGERMLPRLEVIDVTPRRCVRHHDIVVLRKVNIALRRVAAQPDGIVERRHRIVGELPCPGLRRTAAVRDDTVADLGRGFDLGAGLRRPRPVLQRIFVVAASCRQAGCDKGEEHKHFIVFHRFFFFLFVVVPWPEPGPDRDVLPSGPLRIQKFS